MTAKEHDKIWNAAVNNTIKCVLETIDEANKDCEPWESKIHKVRKSIKALQIDEED